MKKQLQYIVTLLLAVLLLCTSCAKLPAMDVKNGKYTNSKTGVTYFVAPSYYEAAAIKEESAVARIKHSETDDIVLYQIYDQAHKLDVPTDKYLATSNYELFCVEGTRLPELWEMGVESVYITQSQAISISLASITNEQEIASLINNYRNGQSFDHSEIDPALAFERYDLKFYSSAYPGIYYNVTYWHFDEDVLLYEDVEDPNQFTPSYTDVEYSVHAYEDGSGDYYVAYHFGTEILFNRSTGACVKAGETVKTYLDSIENETGAN